MSVLIEACVDSAATAQRAVAAGAGRVELCGPGAGGTTPSDALIRECRRAVSVPIHVMIRPREGDFVYDDDELALMMDAINGAKKAGVEGVVLGVLTRSGRVAESELALLTSAARPLKVVFHRAFDASRDAFETFDVLVAHGVNGVLTSGHAPSALEGSATLARLQQKAGGNMEIIAGGSVRAGTVARIVEASGVRAVHARATESAIISDIAAALKATANTASQTTAT